jgi:hypothetical protein
MYGSVNSTIIKQALISCNKKEYISDSKIDWKKMPKKEMHELIEWCEKNFPEEKKFKWYIKKNKDNTFADK